MANGWEFPIRLKLLALMTALILGGTVAYLALAIRLFKEDKFSLVYELNASTVKTLAAETKADLMKFSGELRLLTLGYPNPDWSAAILEGDPELVSYTLYKPTAQADRWEPIKHLGAAATTSDKAIPFSKVLSGHSWAMNSTQPQEHGMPLMTLALAVDLPSGPHVAVAEVRTDRIQKLLSESGAVLAYIVNSSGEVLAHPNAGFVTSHANLSDLPLVREAIDSTVAFQMKPFDWESKHWIGAYAAVGVAGLHVISQVEDAEVFAASRRLIEKSVVFALIVVTLGALLSAWFTRGLTTPIRRLVEATEKLARWEDASLDIKSRDEIGRLARAFSAMSGDLKRQREQIDAHQRELETQLLERTAAHEVLNPLNNMNIRVEKIRDQLNGAEVKPIDVHAALDETSQALADLFDKKKVTFVKDFGAEPRELYTIAADKDELIRVFSNLARNSLHAVEAAHRRAGEVRISTRLNGPRVEIRVTDNGTGISPAYQGKLFEASFTTKSLQEGTGLGLSISRRLVRAFNGDIELERTVEGGGTTFLVWFPGANA